MRVAVIGGGCSGLAAAATLAEKGIPVTVFEAAKQLGGRARGLEWKGKRLDNGQHILIGAYRDTLRLMRLAGVDFDKTLLRLPLQLIQHGKFRLEAPDWLPAPLHLLHGFFYADGLTTPERMAALRLLMRLRLQNFRLQQDEPLAGFLARHRQPDHVTRWLWEPLCLAALNTPLDQASTQIFLNVLRDSFSKSKRDSHLLLPRVDLSELLIEPLGRYITSRGNALRLGTPVSSVKRQGADYVVVSESIEEIFSHVISAVPAFRLSKWQAALPELAEPIALCERFAYQPIASIYVQYPEAVHLSDPMIGLMGGLAQWVLDRGRLDGQAGLLAVVISAEGPHMQLSQIALAETVIAELQRAFPDLPAPLWYKVIIEKRATFACIPDMQRPAQQTRMKNFYLAGDYTAGDYPATIEGAVRSGVACATRILTT